MNIADIRKKAILGKDVSSSTTQSDATRTILPHDDIGAKDAAGSCPPLPSQNFPEFPVDMGSADDTAAGAYEEILHSHGERDLTVSPVTPPMPRHPALFDPLAIILEGREAASAFDEVLVDAVSDSQADTKEYQELLCFRVSSEEYALDIMAIKEIIKPREVTEVPRVPAFVQGVLSLRGIIIPIIDMRVRLGLNDGVPSNKSRVIVVNKGESFCGVLVDEVIQVVKIAGSTIEPPPAVLEGIDREFVNGIGRYENRMLILLNMEKILDISLS